MTLCRVNYSRSAQWLKERTLEKPPKKTFWWHPVRPHRIHFTRRVHALSSPLSPRYCPKGVPSTWVTSHPMSQVDSTYLKCRYDVLLPTAIRYSLVSLTRLGHDTGVVFGSLHGGNLVFTDHRVNVTLLGRKVTADLEVLPLDMSCRALDWRL